MKEYHKIQTLFKRNPENMKRVMEGEFALPEFEFLKDCDWIWTEKVDGTNIRIIWKDGILSFGGKTDNAQIPATLISKLNEYCFQNKFEEHFSGVDVCLYGEGYGAKIQNGGNYRPDQDFVVFDVRIGDWWLNRVDVEDIASKFGLKIVPIIGKGNAAAMTEYVKSFPKSLWGDFESEGIVARPSTELKDRKGYRIITKLKCKDFK